MRAFLLVALLAMAATVSSQDVSTQCKNSTGALDVASVTDAEKKITKTGCTQLEFNPASPQCTQSSGSITCVCNTGLANTTEFETAVGALNGTFCYVTLQLNITGTNQTTPFVWSLTQTNFVPIAYGGACNTTEVSKALFGPATESGLNAVGLDTLNKDSATTGITWNTAAGTVSGCGASSTVTRNIPAAGSTTAPPTNPGATTAPPTNPGATTSPPTGSGNNGATSIGASTLMAAFVAAVVIVA